MLAILETILNFVIVTLQVCLNRKWLSHYIYSYIDIKHNNSRARMQLELIITSFMANSTQVCGGLVLHHQQ